MLSDFQRLMCFLNWNFAKNNTENKFDSNWFKMRCSFEIQFLSMHHFERSWRKKLKKQTNKLCQDNDYVSAEFHGSQFLNAIFIRFWKTCVCHVQIRWQIQLNDKHDKNLGAYYLYTEFRLKRLLVNSEHFKSPSYWNKIAYHVDNKLSRNLDKHIIFTY